MTKKQKISEEKYEALCKELFNSIGNLSRYMHKCGLTKSSLIMDCIEPEDYANLIVRLMKIGDKEVA